MIVNHIYHVLSYDLLTHANINPLLIFELLMDTRASQEYTLERYIYILVYFVLT